MPSPNPEPTDNAALLENERSVKLKELEVRRLEADKALLLSRLRKKSVGGASSPIRRLLGYCNPLISLELNFGRKPVS